MSNEIKPCPCCGSEAEMVVLDHEAFIIQCKECMVGTQIIDDSNKVFSDWNNRASPWIPLKDKMPDYDKFVLFLDSQGHAHYDFIYDEGFERVKNRYTHWMEVPA